MNVEVHPHAVGNCLERVLDIPEEDATEDQKEEATKKILKAVASPDWIYHQKKDMAQIHVKGGVAVPVGVPGEEEGMILPYNSLNQGLKVPTAYKAETFERKRNDGRNKART